MATIYAMPNQDEWDKATATKNGEYDPKGKWDFEAQERLFAKLPKDKLLLAQRAKYKNLFGA